jgi:signal transduction histidine kinase
MLAIVLTLACCVLLALGLPLGRTSADSREQNAFLDRLGDTSRYAARAGQARDAADIDALKADLTRYAQVYGSQAAWLGTNGEVKVASRSDFDIGPRNSEIARRVRAALAGRRSAAPDFLWPWQDRPLVIAEPIYTGGDVVGVVVIVSPTDGLRSSVLAGWAVIAAGSLVVLGLFLVGGVWLTGWALRPVRTLDSAAHAIATGQLTARVPVRDGPPELRRLAAAFNEMADAVSTSIEQQKRFVANASHQLRNPLSALLLRIEELAIGTDDGEKATDGRAEPAVNGAVPIPAAGTPAGTPVGTAAGTPAGMPAGTPAGTAAGTAALTVRTGPAEAVAEAAEEGRRLARLLDDLLAVARLEAYPAEPRRLDVVALLGQRLRHWQIVAERRNIALVGEGAPPTFVHADPTALGSCLDALIDNSLKFSPDGTAVWASARCTGADTVDITVTDQGPGLADEEFALVGQRLWRSNRHQNVEGSGLGLSIVKTLVEPYGGSLAVSRGEEGRGLAVTIRLPPA